MTVLSAQPYRADSTPLATYATGLEIFDGVEGIAPPRPTRRRRAFVDGTDADWDTFYDPKLIRLRLWIAGTDADGAVTHSAGPLGHIRDNLDALDAIFGKTGSAIALEHDVYNGTGTDVDTRTAEARLAGPTTVGGAALFRRLDVPLELPHPFWLGDTVTRGAASSHSFTPGGSAPVANQRLTFAGAGTYVDDQGGTITTTGACVVNVKARTVGSTASLNQYRNRARFGSNPWARWPAGTAVAITVTGTTVAIAYEPAWHS